MQLLRSLSTNNIGSARVCLRIRNETRSSKSDVFILCVKPHPQSSLRTGARRSIIENTCFVIRVNLLKDRETSQSTIQC